MSLYLNQGCTLKDIRIRAAHLIAYFDFSKKTIFSLTLVHWKCLNSTAMVMVTDMIKWHWLNASMIEDHLHPKCQIQNYQNKDRLSVCLVVVGYLLLLQVQHKSKPGCTKPLTGPHRWTYIGGLELGRCVLLLLQGWPTSQRVTATFLTVFQQNATCDVHLYGHTWRTVSTFCLARLRFIVNITHHQHDNNKTLQGIYCYACYLVRLLIYNYIATCGSRDACWPPQCYCT